MYTSKKRAESNKIRSNKVGIFIYYYFICFIITPSLPNIKIQIFIYYYYNMDNNDTIKPTQSNKNNNSVWS